MNKTILALLFAVALTGTAQACIWNKFETSAEVVSATANNPVLPRAAEQTNSGQHGAGVFDSDTLDSLGDVRGTPLNLAASTITVWTHRIINVASLRIIEESCLATAVYFEARSESKLGQLAVAMVILNRVKASYSSSSVCGVVYKGASHLNACQFSFACDGKSDLPKEGRTWETALAVTGLAFADDVTLKYKQMQIVATATHYHADYVNPVWSKSLHRLTKIGHHIFYSQG